jgi:hypothetical protein
LGFSGGQPQVARLFVCANLCPSPDETSRPHNPSYDGRRTQSPRCRFTDSLKAVLHVSLEEIWGTTMKSCLLLAILLLYSPCAQAQHAHAPSFSFASGSGIGNNQRNWGGWEGYGTGGYGVGGSHHHGGLRYEGPREFSTGYVTNDGPYVPSTYMSYDEALALGQQQLATAGKSAPPGAGPSLGEVARAYRSARGSTQAPPTLALQDNSGRLHICNPNGDNCHQL